MVVWAEVVELDDEVDEEVDELLELAVLDVLPDVVAVAALVESSDDVLAAVVVGVVLRIVVQGHDFAPTFIVIASVFVGGCMLGWRGVVTAVSRRRARRALS